MKINFTSYMCLIKLKINTITDTYVFTIVELYLNTIYL